MPTQAATGSPVESSKNLFPRTCHDSPYSKPGAGANAGDTRMAFMKLQTEWYSKEMDVAGKDLGIPVTIAAWLSWYQKKYWIEKVCPAQVWWTRKTLKAFEGSLIWVIPDTLSSQDSQSSSGCKWKHCLRYQVKMVYKKLNHALIHFPLYWWGRGGGEPEWTLFIKSNGKIWTH